MPHGIACVNLAVKSSVTRGSNGLWDVGCACTSVCEVSGREGRDGGLGIGLYDDL